MIQRIAYPLTISSMAAALALAGCAEGAGGTPGEGAPFVERVHIQEKADTLVAGDIAEAATDYVANQFDVIGGLSLDDDFVVKTKSVSANGTRHVRMDQAYNGVKVFGADLVVHADTERFQSISGTLVKQLDGFDTFAEFPEGDAVALAQADYETLAKDGVGNLEFSREATELVVYPVADRDMKLAWHVQFFTELQAGIAPGLWNYFVDAKTGAILAKFNAIHTLSQGSGPGGNAKSPFEWVDQLDVEEAGNGQYRMETARLVTRDMNNSQSGSGTVVQGPLNAVGDAPENDAHGYAEATLNFYSEWYNHDSIDDNGFVIRSRVHYGNQYENAFWDGTQMTYGDGRTTFYPLSGDEDVVAHEISHGYTTFHSNLTYSAQSGGINEAFSDIAGIIISFYLHGDAGDFLIGAKIFKDPDPNRALRYACNPPQDGSSIGHADDYNSGMDVHYSSGVFNKAFCLASKRFSSGDPNGTATQGGVRRVGEAFFEANANYWNASTNFEQGCQGVMDAANALGFSADEVTMLNESFQDVGVFCNGATQPINCDETLTEESGQLSSPNYPNAYPNNVNYTWCVQPASGQPATVTFDAFDTEANYDFVQIRDANGAVLSNVSGTSAPEDATSTMVAITFTSDGSVTRSGFQASWSTGSTQNERPVVEIASPADGATVSDTIIVAAQAQDSDGTIARVRFVLPDGTTVNDDSAPYEINWDSNTVADGEYTIAAIATDNLGADSDAFSVNVVVTNGGACLDGTFNAGDTPISIPDNNSTGITSTISVNGAGNISELKLSLNIDHTYRGDLIVTLISPTGATYTVHNGSGGSADDLVVSDLALDNFNGQAAAGTWSLHVRDRYSADVGELLSWSLEIRGDCGGGGGDSWSGSDEPALPTVDNGSACTSLSVSGSGSAADVRLDLAGTHDWRSVLRGTLEHNGQVIEAFGTGTFASRAGSFSLTDHPVTGFTGDASGTWTLCIIDTDAFGDTGVLSSWSVHN